jgi:hypothetical protein
MRSALERALGASLDEVALGEPLALAAYATFLPRSAAHAPQLDAPLAAYVDALHAALARGCATESEPELDRLRAQLVTALEAEAVAA